MLIWGACLCVCVRVCVCMCMCVWQFTSQTYVSLVDRVRQITQIKRSALKEGYREDLRNGMAKIVRPVC